MTSRNHLVLVGAGHSHIEVLRMFGMHPMAGVRSTLVGKDCMAPYSGMLPGLVAGHYDYYDCHIDVVPLARYAGCRFFQDEVVGLDLEARKLQCRERPPLSFNLLSVNIGSTPAKGEVPGAKEYALPVRPVDRFLDRWAALREEVLGSANGYRVLVVGGGAGGVELTLSMQHNLHSFLAEKNKDTAGLEFHVAMAEDEILPTHNSQVRDRISRALTRKGVRVHPKHTVVEVTEHEARCENGDVLPYDALIWVTHASAPEWIRESGLETDDRGFILVDETLRSTSHPFVFAAGDVATMRDDSRPKSGVFAVRQGPYLSKNLRHALSDEPLEAFSPQKRFLSLISTGEKNAVASRGWLTLEGPRIWRWKDRIDRRFMEKYAELPAMGGMSKRAPEGGMAASEEMRCGGCGCKVGASVLSTALERLNAEAGDEVVVGLENPDDAAVVEVPEGKLGVHTVDFFKSFLDDPYVFGRVTANHCLSDIYAMGASPQTVLAIVTLPYGDEAETEETLYDLLAGTVSVLGESGAALVGGHTTEGSELTFGLSVHGYVDRDGLLRKGGMRTGDRLILTKPLGTGVVFAADMRGKAKGDWVSAAIDAMLISNREGAQCLFKYGATACTDVTGFGLLGHLVEMLEQSGAAAEISLKGLPLLRGVTELSAMGVESTLYPQNAKRASSLRNAADMEDRDRYPIIFDPQTAGGLLASVPGEKADECLCALHDLSYADAAIVGDVTAGRGGGGSVMLLS